MNEHEQIIFDRIAGHGPDDVTMVHELRGEFEGVAVTVTGKWLETPADFFFPDYAGLTDAEIAEVVANNLREEKWNSLRP